MCSLQFLSLTNTGEKCKGWTGTEAPESNTILKMHIFVINLILIYFQKKLRKEDFEMEFDLSSEPAMRKQCSKSSRTKKKLSHVLDTSPVLFLSIWILLYTILLQWVVWEFQGKAVMRGMGGRHSESSRVLLRLLNCRTITVWLAKLSPSLSSSSRRHQQHPHY